MIAADLATQARSGSVAEDDGRALSLAKDIARQVGIHGRVSTSELTPKELDKAACKAVGIEPEIWVWARRVESCQHEKILKTAWDADLRRMREQFRAPERLEIFPRVSEDPAACAMLKAEIVKCGLRLEINLYKGGASAGLWSTYVHESANAATEERAVALAIVAWKEQS